MREKLNESQIDDLLTYINTYFPNYWKNGEKMICCPVHGERHSSMGVNVEKGICHCFSCGFSGDFAKLLAYSKPDVFGLDSTSDYSLKMTEKKAYINALNFLRKRYNLSVEYDYKKATNIKRYEETFNSFNKNITRDILPFFKLAPFKSGIETYSYFLNRGFTKQDMKKFMIGRDLDNETITIPVFYEDNLLAGIIGRYIDINRLKNERYKIYENFDRGKLLYPLNISKPYKGTIILVEGQLDAIRMIQMGYNNTYALMSNSLTDYQANWIFKNCNKVIWIGDNDTRGIESRDKSYKILKRKVDFFIVDYPGYGKDVCDWVNKDILNMINTSHSILVKRLYRIN